MIASFGAELELLDDLLRIKGAVEAAEKEAERNAARAFEVRISELSDKLKERDADAEKLKQEVVHAREKAASEARAEADAKLKEVENDLAQKNKKLDEFRQVKMESLTKKCQVS